MAGGHKKSFSCVCGVDRNSGWRGQPVTHSGPSSTCSTGLCDFCLSSRTCLFTREGKATLKAESSRRVTGASQPEEALGREAQGNKSSSLGGQRCGSQRGKTAHKKGLFTPLKNAGEAAPPVNIGWLRD